MIRWGCRRLRRKLALLAGGDLSGRERELLEAHLARCAACRSEVAGLKRTVRLATESAPGPEELPSLWPALRARLCQEPAAPAPNQNWLPAASLIAATLVVGLTLWATGSHDPSRSFSDEIWMPKEVPGIRWEERPRNRSLVGWGQPRPSARPRSAGFPRSIASEREAEAVPEGALPEILFETRFPEERLERRLQELEARVAELQAELEPRRRGR